MKIILFGLRRRLSLPVLVMTGFAVFATNAVAGPSPVVQVKREVLSAGGGTASGGVYSLTDTAGQPCVGTSSSTSYAMAEGFWPDYGALPVAASLSLGAKFSQTTGLSVAKVLLLSSDPNGEVLSVVSVSGTSTNGGVVAKVGDLIEYTPADGVTSTDAFTYVIADTGGDAATGTVAVNLTAVSSGGSYNQLATEVAGSEVHLTFLGIPNLKYALDRTYNLTLPIAWVPQFTNTTAANGVMMFTNTPTPGTNNYWRTRYVP